VSLPIRWGEGGRCLRRGLSSLWLLNPKLHTPPGYFIPTRPDTYQCSLCDQLHVRWRLGDTSSLEAHFALAGMEFHPQLAVVNGRNLRIVFNRYNAKFNKGLLPSSRAPCGLTSRPGCRGDEGLQADMWSPRSHLSSSSECPASTSPSRTSGGPVCPCQVRSLGLMERDTFMRLCLDNRTIQRALKGTNGSLSMEKIEGAFLTTCSIGGLVCGSDVGKAQVSMCRGYPAQVDGPQPASTIAEECSSSCASPLPTSRSSIPSSPRPHSVQCRAGGKCCCVAGAHSVWKGGRIGAPTPLILSCPSSPRLPFGGRCSVPASPSATCLSPRPGPPKSRNAAFVVADPLLGGPSPKRICSLSTPSTPRLSSARPSKGPQHVWKPSVHRQPAPSLTFPQFLEALRLVAEDLVGHPQVLSSAELAMWSILHDVALLMCVLPVRQGRHSRA
jgi:hypothetical protein